MERSRHMHIASCVLLITIDLCTVTLINGTQSILKRRQTQCPCSVENTRVDCSRRSLDSIPSCIPASVTDLILENNRISHIDDFAFDGMHSLTALDLGYNNLTTVRRGMFVNLKSVKYLGLANNRISHIEDFAFDGMHSLTTLNIGSNNLTTVTRGMFVNLSSIKVLALANNRISHIEDFAFDGMHSLITLDLTRNNLTTVTRGMFINQTSVKFLSLYYNNLKTIPRDVFADLTSIQTIDIRQNVDLQLPDIVCALKHKEGFIMKQYFRDQQPFCSCLYLNIKRQSMSDCTSINETGLTSILWSSSSYCSTLDFSIMSESCQESEASMSSTYKDETTSDVSMSSTYRNETTSDVSMSSTNKDETTNGNTFIIPVIVGTVITLLVAIGVSVLVIKRGWPCFAKRSQDIGMSALRDVDADEGRPKTGSNENSEIYDEIVDVLEDLRTTHPQGEEEGHYFDHYNLIDFASVSPQSNKDGHVKQPSDSVFYVVLEPEVLAHRFHTPNSRPKEESVVSEDGKKHCERNHTIIPNTEITDCPIKVHSALPLENPESQEDNYLQAECDGIDNYLNYLQAECDEKDNYLHAVSDDKDNYLHAVSDEKDNYLHAVSDEKCNYLHAISDEKEIFSH